MVDENDVFFSENAVDFQGGMVGSVDHLFILDVRVDEGLRRDVQPDDLAFGLKQQLARGGVQQLARRDQFESAANKALF